MKLTQQGNYRHSQTRKNSVPRISLGTSNFMYVGIQPTSHHHHHHHHTPARIHTKLYTVRMRTVLQAGRSQVRFPMVSWEFFFDIILPAAYGPGVDSASNRNEYQEYFLGLKADGT
jgi:hypothetical protein